MTDPTSLDALLEVRIYPTSGPTPAYEVELQFDDLSSQGQNEPVRGAAPISPETLSRLQGQPQLYGETLSESLFHDPEIRSALSLAKATVALAP